MKTEERREKGKEKSVDQENKENYLNLKEIGFN
jgi:hypothetical protein